MSAICVGSIADEKNDFIYWFVSADGADYIYRHGPAGNEYVFVDTLGTCLKFGTNIITGINILD